ncbi:MAG TPA: carbamoyltransferase HypF [Gemmataceae bacterium]|nr:carbamoyltransferase HypF [Gemmataceae bacterium]
MNQRDLSSESPKPETEECVRLHLEVRGAVQGVGFRPFVYRLANELGLAGWVNNSPQGAAIEVEGDRGRIAEFLRRLPDDKPRPCVLHSLAPTFLPQAGYTCFEVHDSSSNGPKTAVILPDLATCLDCQREIFDPKNRRFRYPFANCTNCGPRFSIVEELPYDRPRTTMKRFPMCDACRAEYDNPADRRFHAQPNACPRCGPHLELWDAAGNVLAAHDDALRAAADALRRGDIVAAKGLGGFHLLVDAHNQDAVLRLRRRKHREEKPFGLMYPHLDTLRRDCPVSELEERILLSPESPLVLLRRRESRARSVSEGTALAYASGTVPCSAAVAPGNPNLGVMLPYTPLHHLLLAELGFPIVATSGNRSDEPICLDECEALTRLAGIADLFLIHDRPIARQVDDSVVRVVLGREMVLRRARGYAPFPVPVAQSLPPLLAVGAHQKNTLAIAAGCQVVVSQHVGDLDTPIALMAFHRIAEDLPRLYALEPQAVVCDRHPDYHSTRHAENMGLPIVRVQHHHAHVRAVMAEHGLSGPLLGVAWDGTGLGLDGTIWGGEFLRVGGDGFERRAYLRRFRLPGGERAVREPRRTALGLLYELLGEELFDCDGLAPLRSFSQPERGVLRGMLRGGVNAPWTSSAGRLFDAVAALLDIRQTVAFEGQAAVELEFAADGAETAEPYPFVLTASGLLDWGPMIRAILETIRLAAPAAHAPGSVVGTIARRFHDTLAETIVAVARFVGERIVALSGGCFQNAYLLEQTVTRLRDAGFRVYWPERIPPNDGGIALGQILAAV